MTVFDRATGTELDGLSGFLERHSWYELPDGIQLFVTR